PNLQYPDPAAIDLAAIVEAGFEVYGLPLQANALVAIYRQDLFEAEAAAFEGAAGRALAFPGTVEEFVEVAAFFTRQDDNLYGTTLMPGTGDWATDDFKTFLAAWGGNGYMVNDDFSLAFNSQEGIDALTWYAALINEHRVTPPGVTSFSWDDASAAFTQGLTAMSMNYHTEVLSPEVQGNIAYALVPEQTARGPHFGTWMLSVNPYGRNKPWAYRAAQWFTSGATQTAMLAAQLHPSRKSVYEAAQSDENATRFGNFYDILGQSLALGVGRPRLTNYGAVDQVIWVAVNNAANGAQTPEEALNEAATEVTELLRAEGYPVP
ncbi:MAG: extracellular solute-binding protein, partial [Chloroflexia bacterium]|nr:extracellular solute-binding protein [Chloroflexia bacterium]